MNLFSYSTSHRKKSQVSSNVLLLCFLTLFFLITITSLALSNELFSITTDKENYIPNENVYVSVYGPSNAEFTMSVFNPYSRNIGDYNGTTGIYGTYSLLLKGSSSVPGKYNIKLHSDGIEQSSTLFNVIGEESVVESVNAPEDSEPDVVEEVIKDKATNSGGKRKINKSFRLDETPEFSISKKKSLGLFEIQKIDDIKAKVVDYSGNVIDVAIDIEDKKDKHEIRILKERNVRPGLYMLSIETSSNQEELWFAWGLVSVNTRKSIYHPNETAEILIVVLDKYGYPVSEADINLIITDPESNPKTLSTSDNSLLEIEKGVYQADYLTGKEGNYTLLVTATATEVTSSIESYFSVRDYYKFDILREIPATIDPQQGPFESSIRVISYTYATSFNLTEYLPLEFEVTYNGGASVTISDDAKILTWTNLSNNSLISYSAQVPLIWPYLYEIGPAGIEYDGNPFTEARPWILAVDPTDPPTSCDGGWTSCTNAYTNDSNYAERTSDGSGAWSGYGLNILSGSTINSVKVPIQHYCGDATKHFLDLEVYNGSSWGVIHDITPSETACTLEIVDVSSDFSWTPSMVNAIQVRLTADIGTGGPSNKWVRCCHLPVEVDYNPAPPTINYAVPGESNLSRYSGNTTLDINVTADYQINYTNYTIYHRHPIEIKVYDGDTRFNTVISNESGETEVYFRKFSNKIDVDTGFYVIWSSVLTGTEGNASANMSYYIDGILETAFVRSMDTNSGNSVMQRMVTLGPGKHNVSVRASIDKGNLTFNNSEFLFFNFHDSNSSLNHADAKQLNEVSTTSTEVENVTGTNMTLEMHNSAEIFIVLTASLQSNTSNGNVTFGVFVDGSQTHNISRLFHNPNIYRTVEGFFSTNTSAGNHSIVVKWKTDDGMNITAKNIELTAFTMTDRQGNVFNTNSTFMEPDISTSSTGYTDIEESKINLEVISDSYVTLMFAGEIWSNESNSTVWVTLNVNNDDVIELWRDFPNPYSHASIGYATTTKTKLVPGNYTAKGRWKTSGANFTAKNIQFAAFTHTNGPGYNEVYETSNSTHPYTRSFKWNDTIVPADMNWREGTYRIETYAEDNLGNSTTKSVIFEYDIDAPVVNLVSPATDYISGNSTVIFTYKVSSNVNVTNCSLEIPRGNIVTTNHSITKLVNQTFNYTFISDGNYEWTVSCTDENNRVAEAAPYRDVMIDTTEPTATLVLPANDTYITTESQRVYSTATDGSGSGVSCVEFQAYYDGGWNPLSVNCSAPYEYMWNLSSINDQIDIQVRARANDTIGNLGGWDTHVNITHYTAVPTIYVNQPQNITYNNNTVNLEVSADKVIDTWIYQFNGNGTNYTFTPNTTLYFSGNDGTKYLEVWNNGTIGNIGYNITYFTTAIPPAINLWINNSADNSTTVSGDVNLTASTDETGDCIYYINNIGQQYTIFNSSTYGSNISLKDDDDYTYNIYCRDTSNNWADKAITFTHVGTLSSNDIGIYVYQPENKTYNNNTVNLEVSANDTVNTWTLNANNGSGNYTFTPNTTFTLGSEGAHKLTIYGKGSSTVTGINYTYFTVDTTAPTIKVYQPQNITYTNSTINIEFSIDDGTNSTIIYQFNGNGTNYTASDNSSSIYLGSDGTKTFEVWNYDNASNIGYNIIYLTKDTTPPSLSTDSPLNNTWDNDGTIDFVFRANESISSIVNCSLYANFSGGGLAYIMSNTSKVDNSTPETIQKTGINDGSYIWNINCSDSAGNWAFGGDKQTNVDTTPPTVKVYQPYNITYSNNSVPISFSIDEEHINSTIIWQYNSNGTNYTATDNTTLLTFSGSDGTKHLEVWNNDTIGNIGYNITYFTADATPPNWSNKNQIINEQYIEIIHRDDSIKLSAYWNDLVRLDTAWLETNETSIWENKTVYNSPLKLTEISGWSNFTWQNSSVTPGSNVSWRIYANDTIGNTNYTDIMSFSVWGWSEINESSLNPSTINQGESATMTCQVRDNVTSDLIENYTVYFYNSTDLIGTNLTDENGRAYYTFIDNSYGYETIICNITDNETLHYNKSINNQAQENLNTQSVGSPLIYRITSDPCEKGTACRDGVIIYNPNPNSTTITSLSEIYNPTSIPTGITQCCTPDGCNIAYCSESPDGTINYLNQSVWTIPSHSYLVFWHEISSNSPTAFAITANLTTKEWSNNVNDRTGVDIGQGYACAWTAWNDTNGFDAETATPNILTTDTGNTTNFTLRLREFCGVNSLQSGSNQIKVSIPSGWSTKSMDSGCSASGNIITCDLTADLTNSYTDYRIELTAPETPGKHVLQTNVTGTDNGGAVHEDVNEHIILVKDGTAPGITLHKPLNNSYTVDNATIFSFTATDDFAEKLNCSLHINSILNQTNESANNNTKTEFAVNGLSLGSYTWNITCKDDELNQNWSLTREFAIHEPRTVNITLVNSLNKTYNDTKISIFDNLGQLVGSKTIDESDNALSDELALNQTYDIVISTPLSSGDIVAKIKNINITENLNVNPQVVENYTGSIPTGNVSNITALFALNDTGLSYELVELYIPKKALNITNITHCINWNFTDSACSEWEVNNTAEYNMQENDTYIWFNVTEFDAFGGGQGNPLPNITWIRIYDVTGLEDTHSGGTLIGSGLNTTFNFYLREKKTYRVEMDVKNDGKTQWTIASEDDVYHDYLNSSWEVNVANDIWYVESATTYTGGTWSGGKVKWDTALGGKLTNGETGTFYYVFNMTTNRTEQYYPYFLCNDTSAESGSYDYSTYNITRVGYLEVNLTLPPSIPGDGSSEINIGYLIGQNKTFMINATVYCRDGYCGKVNGTLRYNESHTEPDTNISTTPKTPFYILESPALNPKDCNYMSEDNFCNVTWTINSTGTIGSLWNIDALFNSSLAENNDTGNIVMETGIVLIMHLGFDAINFSTQNPGAEGVAAENNTDNYYNITIDENSNDVEGLYIKGENLTGSHYILDVRDISWNATGHSAVQNVTYDYELIKQNIASGTNITTYYWMNVPYGEYPGLYSGKMYFMINATY